ncbi:DUF2237 family protein [Agaribacter marinus]|uniref:DUF2237 domain-containing protein n=1 Tax=Agaribacter marinus TaxID=1431249 RepID=A0AA37T4G2_9ALTE|nr:DUF2237 domain-containing protein [Agaribacter marinus]GLR71843.1 hypothetical protein GCM10007852_27510 [Agaribacter marinus]
MANETNVYGKPLQLCCGNTGFTREGFCYVPTGDTGNHSICAIMTDEFLAHSKSVGNDLISPNPMYGFNGLNAGDRWCLCAIRWKQALSVGAAPFVILDATNSKSLEIVSLSDLETYRYIA